VGAAVASASSVVVSSVPVWEEEQGSVEDLAMPSPEEHKAKEVRVSGLATVKQFRAILREIKNSLLVQTAALICMM